MATAPEKPASTSQLDLVLTRTIDAPPALIWKAWTDPEHIKKWWTPAPWTTVECEMDLRPGGIFRTVMRSPEGQDFPGVGCFLELVENERIAWTNALEPGFRPATNDAASEQDLDCHSLIFTAIVTLEEQAGGTQYTARVLHKDEAGRKRHEEMGFHDGWGKCLDQLAALMARLKG